MPHVRLRDNNGPIPQVQEILQNQNNGNQRLRIQLSHRDEDANNNIENNDINNQINIDWIILLNINITI